MPLNLVITNFGSLTFKILQPDFIALSSSFSFICSCISIIILSILLFSYSVTFSFSISSNDLNLLSLSSIGMSYLATLSRYLFPPLFYFFENNLIVFHHYFVSLFKDSVPLLLIGNSTRRKPQLRLNLHFKRDVLMLYLHYVGISDTIKFSV